MNSRPIHVLLVEDNPADVGLIRRLIARAGQDAWQMVHCEQLNEAFEACVEYADVTQGNQFDVVLLDLNLPDSNGLETMLQFHRKMPWIPVVVLSGMSDEQIALQAIASGAQEYLVKEHTTIQRLMQAMKWAIARVQFSRSV
jgi:CheY-like chemotaxis protein